MILINLYPTLLIVNHRILFFPKDGQVVCGDSSFNLVFTTNSISFLFKFFVYLDFYEQHNRFLGLM